MWEALCRRHRPAVQLLVEAGADLSAGHGGMYARVAVEEDDAALLEEIVRCGRDVTVPCCGDGATALHRAVLDGNARMARLLLEHGAVADREDAHGWTARAMAERHGHAEIQLLFASSSQGQETRNPASATVDDRASGTAVPLITKFRSTPAARSPLSARDGVGVGVGSPPSLKRGGPSSSSSSSARSTPQRLANFRNSLFGVISSSAHWSRHDDDGRHHHHHERDRSSPLARVTVSCPEQSGDERRLAFLPETMRQLLELGASRFGFAATRVVTSGGAEVDDVRLVKDGGHLLLVSEQWERVPDSGTTRRNQSQ